MSHEDQKLVTIGETLHHEEALAWRDLLRSAGYTVFLRPEVSHANPYPGTVAEEPFKVLVREDRAEEARQDLDDLRANKEPDNPDEED